MEASFSVPIKIGDKEVGVINIDEKLFRDACGCGDEAYEVLRNAGGLLAMSLKNARLENDIKMLDSVKADFISSFPHELRIPITVIKNALDMIEDGTLGDINEKQKKSLTLAASNVERLWRLSEELMELSAIALAKTPMKRKLFDIVVLAGNAAAKFNQAANEQGVTLLVELPPGKNEMWGDETKLSQMFECLVDNAIKYNSAGGKVGVKVEDADKLVRISISDTGKGMSQDDAAKVFDKFYRVTMRAKNEDRKWGIGLPVVKEIIELHRGTISLQSEVGKGSLFVIMLPKSLR